METKIHERSAIERELEFTIPEAEIQSAFTEAYKEIRPRLSLPGFRPGKAPMHLVKKMHGDAVEGDAIEKLAQEKFQKVAKELDIRPIGVPVMTDLHRHAGEGLHVKVQYEISPEFEVQDWAGMEVEHSVFTVEEADIDDRLQRAQFSLAERETAEIVSGEQMLVTVDMKELESEAGKQPASSKNVQIYLADPEIQPAIKEAIDGKKVGDSFTVDLPKHRTDSESDERKSPIEVTLTKIEKVILPALDEEFVKKVTGDKISTLEELRERLSEDLEAAAKQRSEEELEENLVNNLLGKHEFEVPRTITHAIIDQMIEDRKERNKRAGFPADYNIDEKEIRKELWPVAELRGKWVILRDKLIASEKLEVDDEDIEAHATKEAEKYGIPVENLITYYKGNEQLKDRLLSDKLSERLKEKATITAKPVNRKV